MAVDIGDWFNLGSKNISKVKEYNPGQDGGLFVILSIVLKNIYIIAGLILLFFIFIGGIGMILNAGNTEKQKQSSKTLGSAVVGFLILFLSYWIVKIIQYLTGIQLLYFL